MSRIAATVFVQLALAGALHGQTVFRTPATLPAQPLAGQPVSARVVDGGACFGAEFTVERPSAHVLEVRYVRPPCQVLPTGVAQDMLLGRLVAGVYDLRLVDVSDPQHPRLTDETIIRVDGAACDQVPATGPAPLCLQGGRYEITAEWTAYDGTTGDGRPVPYTEESGAFWFFGPENTELLVKILDGCASNGKFWLYVAGLTDVQVTLRIHDTLLGFEYTYTNELGTPFEPIRDTGSLMCTCEICSAGR
jgi:hypothetical protein